MKKIVFMISILILLTMLFLGFKLVFNNKENNELDYTTIKENIISFYARIYRKVKNLKHN